MKILVIGSGGREHSLCWKLKNNPRVQEVFCAPGNGGTALLGENVDIEVDDIEGLLDFAKEKNIDLTVVGPELPLVLGIVDRFNEEGLRIFGVNKECAQLEGSKDFSKAFMEKYDIPTARYKSFTDLNDALEGIKDFTYPLVIKADGLCLGKGVVICEDEDMANATLKDILGNKVFGSEGDKVVIEEFLHGVEASLICIVSEGKIIPMESAKDYKQIFEGDNGPNTGGVGCYSPNPILTREIVKKVEKNIFENIKYGLVNEGMDFKGVLFIGLMIDNDDPKVLEFNVRFGDPETEVLLPRLESDIITILQKTIDGTVDKDDFKWSDKHCTTVVLTSDGYPGRYKKGEEITGYDNLSEETMLFHNGTKYENEKLYTNGGRVLSLTALGESLEDSRHKVYKEIEKIHFNNMKYRRDIGKY